MRYLNTILCLLMLSFIAVQYNDPDGLFWMVAYLIPAVWAAIAAFRARWLNRPPVRTLLLACIVAALLGVVHFWPDSPRWWTREIWHAVESAREGMGLMIVVIVLAVVWQTARRVTNRPSG